MYEVCFKEVMKRICGHKRDQIQENAENYTKISIVRTFRQVLG